jgi:hypothetical protein
MVLADGLLIIAMMATQVSVPGPDVAQSDDATGQRMHIGDTGIRCVKFPCPSRGLFLPGETGDRREMTLLAADYDGRMPPPPMIGDEADLAAVRAAWASRDCLAIEGRMVSGIDDKPVLRIDRVHGRCAE